MKTLNKPAYRFEFADDCVKMIWTGDQVNINYGEVTIHFMPFIFIDRGERSSSDQTVMEIVSLPEELHTPIYEYLQQIKLSA